MELNDVRDIPSRCVLDSHLWKRCIEYTALASLKYCFSDKYRHLRKAEAPDLQDHKNSVAIEVTNSVTPTDAQIIGEFTKLSQVSTEAQKEKCRQKISQNGAKLICDGFMAWNFRSPETGINEIVNAFVRKLNKVSIYRQSGFEKIYLPKWEKITGLYCNSWQTKYMTTRWGTCNTNTRKIWFNLQLAKKPIECLEYVVLHELAHLKVRNHGKDFIAIMDQYMPYWRETKKLLNELKLDHMDEVEGYDAMHDITCD